MSIPGKGRPEAILDRVRKLLALATSPNVHEAAAAAAKAQELVARHRLEGWLAAASEAASEPITDGREAPLTVARRLRKWKIALAQGLAEANGCLVYTGAVGDETGLFVAGREEDRAVVAELFGWLVQRLEWLSATHGPGRSRDWHESFRIGAADAVVEGLSQLPVEADTPAGALVVVEPLRLARAEALETWAAHHLGKGKGRAIRVDARAFERGKAAAAAIVVPKGR